MKFCKYKNIFGKPNEGAHSYRIFGLALVDILATLVLTAIVKYILEYVSTDPKNSYSFFTLFLIVFFIGQLFHIMFCVDTAFLTLIKKSI